MTEAITTLPADPSNASGPSGAWDAWDTPLAPAYDPGQGGSGPWGIAQPEALTYRDFTVDDL